MTPLTMSEISPKTHIVTCDLDSTLCDTGHRHRLIDRVNGTDWDAYSLACVGDAVVEPTRVLVWMLAKAGYEIHYVSGRTQAAFEQTRQWLTENMGFPEDGLWMDNTPGGDHFATFGGHAEYKLARLREVEAATKKKIALHLDDWAEVKVTLEDAGIPCLCVRTPQEVVALVEQSQELA